MTQSSASTQDNLVDLGPKLVSAERALAANQAGSRIYGCAAPRKLLARLEAMEPAEVKIYSGLKSSPLFAGLSSSALNDILGRMTARSYTTNQYICREGDISDRMYLLESGAVEVIVGEGSAAQVVAHLRRGDIFGEMGLLSDEPRAASTLTTMPTLVLELDRSAFTEISICTRQYF
jgi:hypothetical protein